MTYEAWITIGVVAGLFLALALNLGATDVLFVGAAAILAMVGIITPAEAFAGFSNPGVITVATLFIVAAALRETGILDMIGRQLLGGARTASGALARLAGVTMPMSAFLNNTPIVAMFLPVIMDWSRRHQVAPSRLLIPLSFFTILGGTCTLIGTSTNLVVDGMMRDHGMRGMGLFELGRIGLPYAVIGCAYLFLFGPRLLPERKELIEQMGESRREYLVEMLVRPECRLIGRTVEGAGLRQLPGLFLIEIDRAGTIIAPVGPNDILGSGDRLIFTGVVSGIIELEKIPGLVPAADPAYEVSPSGEQQRRLCEAVISASSPLVGQTIRDADFRATYGAAIVAVHRGGRRIEMKIGDIALRPGDTLLMQTGPHFIRAHRNDPAFYLVSDVEDWRPLRRHRAWTALAIFLVLIAFMSASSSMIAISATAAAVAMIAMGCISAGDARRSVEWQVLIAIAAAFGVGSALENSGAAAALAGALVDLTRPIGPLATLAAIYLVVSILTEIVTNNAAAILMFPVCLSSAEACGVDSRPFLMALVLAASASFMTPIGYQTNMMVYGPGGYRFSDFMRIGAPLNLLLWGAAVALIPLFWPF